MSIFTKQTNIHKGNLKYARSTFYTNINNDVGHDMKTLYKISHTLLVRANKKKLPEKS